MAALFGRSISTNKRFGDKLPMSESQSRSKSEARSRYERVTRIVRFNTGPGDPRLAEKHVQVVASHCGLDADAVRSSLRAAVQNDDLLRISRGETTYYVHPDEERLAGLLEREVASDDPDKQLIARCNQLLDDVREGDHGD